MNLVWRYPDKMPEAKYPKLKILEDRGGYVCQQKLDGYRLIVTIQDGKVSAQSRHRKLLPVSQRILDQFLLLDLPNDSMIDTEWIKMRGGESERIALLDSLYLNGVWMGGQPLDVRRASWWGKELPPGLFVPKEVTNAFIPFLSEQIEDKDPAKTVSEGVVVKRLDAKLIGDRTKSAENPLWAKVKWRHGEAGDTVILTKELLNGTTA